MASSGHQQIIYLNVGGKYFSTSLATIVSEEESLLFKWFSDPEPPLPLDKKGAYFLDRDPWTFNVILNYLRLKSSNQLWEACLPKDPDKLALLTQEQWRSQRGGQGGRGG